MSRIAVLGAGYVGLTTAACFSHLGHQVICADVLPDRVDLLSRGEVPIREAGLEELIRTGLDGGHLSFVVGEKAAAEDCEFCYLCVPTPQGADGSADLSFIRQAASAVRDVLPAESVVVNKSTVPVGSTRVVEQALGRDDVRVASNPEFLREGSAVHDFLHPDRIVIGCEDQATAGRVAALFEGIQAPVIVTDPASAETIKYASNAFLATKVSFVNAIANVCEAVGADVREVVLGMGYDRRIGFEFLKPGPGWGGSCFVGDETVLVRRGEQIRLQSFEELFAEVTQGVMVGYEALAWRPGAEAPEFLPVRAVTARPYEGEVLTIRTKMGRRVTCTPDHPFVVGDGVSSGPTAVKLAGELVDNDWLPIAQGNPWVVPFDTSEADLFATIGAAGLEPSQIIGRLSVEQRTVVAANLDRLPARRRRDVMRAGTARLSELYLLDAPVDSGSYGTTTNGTYVPPVLNMDDRFWRLIGLFIAEGHIGVDGARRRVMWSYHPSAESELVEFTADYFRDVGVKVDVHRGTTTMQVTVSSRILAGWLEEAVGSSYDKRVPDHVWDAGIDAKRALLRGLWDGDGSWSYVAGRPSVVFEYGTVSRRLADGILRLLGDLGITARLKVGRAAKSTVDTYWLTISGADQLERALWLFPDDEAATIRDSLDRQAKRIAPTGYRRLDPNASWTRIANIERRPFSGAVYSLEIPAAGTVVTTGGLVAHNCFPKDTQALIRIAEDAGYDFGLLRGVVEVNDEQFDRVVAKVERMTGGSVDDQLIAAWGLTFKARTDDLRGSPAVEVLHRLQKRGAQIRAYDPAVTDSLDGLEVAADPYAACEGAAVLLVLTEWDEFRWLDFEKVGGLMAERRLVDARNLLDPAAVRRRGFAYDGVGRS